MKKLALASILLLVALLAERSAGQAQQQQQQAPPQPRESDFRERYQILTDRNIFLRNRTRPQSRTPTTNQSGSSSRSARRPEQSYTLTGIILEEGRRIAFIENATTGTTERLAVGAPIARGKITDVGFNYLEFESATGERTKVEIGTTLAGSTQGSAVASTQPAAAEESSAPIDLNNPNLSAADRLKLRRQQELKK